MPDQGFEKVATLADLDEGIPTGFRLERGEQICLIRVNDQVYACPDRCTHAEFPLSEGDMVDDYVLECALHGAQFDVRTGDVLELPATEPLALYDVKVDGDDVWVKRET